MTLDCLYYVSKDDGIRSSLLDFLTTAKNPTIWKFKDIQTVEATATRLLSMVNISSLTNEQRLEVQQAIQEAKEQIINTMEA